MAGIGKSPKPGRGFGKQNIKPHSPSRPDLAFHIRSDPHRNLYIVKRYRPVSRNLIGNNLEASDVFPGIDQACILDRIAEGSNHFYSHWEETVLHVEPLNMR